VASIIESVRQALEATTEIINGGITLVMVVDVLEGVHSVLGWH